MTATQQRPPSTDGAKAGLAALGQLRPTRAQLRRSRARVGVAIALAVACGSLFALLYGSAGNRRPVLALARAVPAVRREQHPREHRAEPLVVPGLLGCQRHAPVGPPMERADERDQILAAGVVLRQRNMRTLMTDGFRTPYADMQK